MPQNPLDDNARVPLMSVRAWGDRESKALADLISTVHLMQGWLAGDRSTWENPRRQRMLHQMYSTIDRSVAALGYSDPETRRYIQAPDAPDAPSTGDL